MKLTNILEKLF